MHTCCFGLYVWKCTKKLLIAKNYQNAVFTVNNFLCIFKKTDQKKCVCLLSVKLNQSRNTKKFFVQFQKFFSPFFFIVKGSFTTIFTQKYLLLLGLMEFFKNVNLNAPCATKFWIWTFKIIPDLRLSAVFCPIKKIKNHSTLICTVH